jgi:hypothetical protein
MGSRRSASLRKTTIGGADFHVVPNFPLENIPDQRAWNAGSYVYILRSDLEAERFYVGQTQDYKETTFSS